MAIETEPGTSGRTGGGEPAGQAAARPWWMRPGILTGIIGAVAGYALGHWLGNLITSGYPQAGTGGGSPDSNDTPIVLGYLFLVVGWLAGMGIFNDLGRQMAAGGSPTSMPKPPAWPGTSGSRWTTRWSASSTWLA